MNNYWEKIKKDFQYQLEEILNCAAHLEYLQAVFREFDSAINPNKKTMIQYFWKSLRLGLVGCLKPGIRLWEEVVEKAVNIEAKVLLQSPFSTRKIGIKCLRGYKPAKKEEKDPGKTKSADFFLANMPGEKSTH